MGWGVNFMDYASRVTRQDARDKMYEEEANQKRILEKIKAFAYGAPRDIKEEGDFRTWEDYVTFEMEMLLDELEETTIKIHKLQQVSLQDEEEYRRLNGE